jgi:parvulin-like peptidyl-prolyl isomerase
VKRILALAACVVALASACGGKDTGRAAAVVNGSRIEQRAVVDELEAISANSDYLDFIDKRLSGSGQKVKGSEPGTYDAGFVSQVLLRQIEFNLVHDEVRRRGLAVSDECKAAALNDTYTNLGEGTAATGQQLFEKFPKAYQETLLGWNLDQLVLMADLAGQPCVTDDAAKAYYEAHTDEFQQTCFSAVQVATKQRADELAAQINAGADFATIADAEGGSSSTAPGGDQGCHAKGDLRADLVDPIFSAPVGSVSAIDAGGVGVVLKINSRKQATLDEARDQAGQAAAQAAGSAFSQWFKDASGRAQVDLDPRYGTFDSTGFTITPPPTPGAASTSTDGTQSGATQPGATQSDSTQSVGTQPDTIPSQP